MDPNRKLWNARQQELRQALSETNGHQKAVELFLHQHALVHTAEVSQSGLPTFEDAVWHGLSEEQARVVPAKQEHSIAWIFWHLTRIEDATMNVLLAGKPQLFVAEGWAKRMGVTLSEVGNAMSAEEMAGLSDSVDIPVLRSYRLAVGKCTRENVRGLSAGAFLHPVEARHLQQLFEEGAVEEGSRGLLDYWGGLTKGGLLLMPPTRHSLVHLNEAMQIKQRLSR